MATGWNKLVRDRFGANKPLLPLENHLSAGLPRLVFKCQPNLLASAGCAAPFQPQRNLGCLLGGGGLRRGQACRCLCGAAATIAARVITRAAGTVNTAAAASSYPAGCRSASMRRRLAVNHQRHAGGRQQDRRRQKTNQEPRYKSLAQIEPRVDEHSSVGGGKNVIKRGGCSSWLIQDIP